MGAEVRPDLPDNVTDTGGVTASVNFTELNGFRLANEGSVVEVTGVPDPTPAPFAEQHDITRQAKPSPEPRRTQGERHGHLGQEVAQIIKLNRERQSRRPTTPNSIPPKAA